MHGLRSFKIIIFLLLYYYTLPGQQANFTLSALEFTGLHKTKEDYLRNLMSERINEGVTYDLIKEDLQILRNLPSIGQCDYTVDTTGHTVKVAFQIEERRTALPIINFGGVEGNVYFTLGFIDNNFLGNGDQFLAYYQNNDALHSGQIHFKKQRIIGSDWGYSFTLNKWSSQEPVFFPSGTLQYYYDNNGVTLSLLRNLGLNNVIEISSTYFKESYDKLAEQAIDDPSAPDNFAINKFLTKLEARSNYLNYHYFYITGHETMINYQNVLSIDNATRFNSLIFQGKLFFRPKKKLNVGIRVKLGISTNEDSPFAPFVADSYFNIRGIGNRIDRGTAQAVLNLEARYTLLDEKKWSSQFVVFSDSGTWRDPGGQIQDIFNREKFRQFVGLGFRATFNKIFGATLRVDYGIDIYDLNQRGLVLGLGQYF